VQQHTEGIAGSISRFC